MRTLIINGSPKQGDGNTGIFIERFSKGAGARYETRYAYRGDPDELARYMEGFDALLFFMPLYVHAMPGGVMKLLERMQPSPGKKIGFVLQYGFAEGHQAAYVKKFFEAFAARMQFAYLGTAARGNSAGVTMMPERMNRALFSQIEALGAHYAQTGAFREDIVAQWMEPYSLKKSTAKKYEFLYKAGLGNLMWNHMLRANHALDKKQDRPFADGDTIPQ